MSKEELEKLERPYIGQLARVCPTGRVGSWQAENLFCDECGVIVKRTHDPVWLMFLSEERSEYGWECLVDERVAYLWTVEVFISVNNEEIEEEVADGRQP
jgi:hypothetical protein